MMRQMLERTRFIRSGLIVACGAGALWIADAGAQSKTPIATGPLTVHPDNPRYFADASGKAVYLTGSHTWSNLQDEWTDSFQETLDFEDYLDLLESNHHNFIRLWRWELPQYMYEGDAEMRFSEPHPWMRVGAASSPLPAPVVQARAVQARANVPVDDVGADDAGADSPNAPPTTPPAAPVLEPGQGPFDLTQFNQNFFDRLRERVEAAGQRGIYVSIMLFEGHGLGQAEKAWASHPFNPSNNVNGIDGDVNGDDIGTEIQTLENPDVLAVQEAYVKKVIDTVNDLDNVLFEIANQSAADSVEWQNHMIALVKSHEATLPKQHPVLFSAPLASGESVTDEILTSDADAVSPAPPSAPPSVEGDAAATPADDPPAADGTKVVISDSNNVFGCGGTTDWVWKSFTRGLNVIYMDSYYEDSPFCAPPSEEVRANLGATRLYAERMDLSQAIPMGELASSGFALVDAGDSYLVYLPEGGRVTVDLSGVAAAADESGASLPVEWFNPQKNEAVGGSPVIGGAVEEFTAPFEGPAILFVGGSPAPVGGPDEPTLSPPDVGVDADDVANTPPANEPGFGDADIDGDIGDIGDVGAGGGGNAPGVVSDLDADGTVGIDDVKLLVDQWGDCPPSESSCTGDLDGDGKVDLSDVIALLSDWTG